MKDVEWIADLHRPDLLKASFIPPQPFCELRGLIHYHKTLMQEHTQKINRLQKVLEGPNILGKIGWLMQPALTGESADPDAMAELAPGSCSPSYISCSRRWWDGCSRINSFSISACWCTFTSYEESIAQVQHEDNTCWILLKKR